MKASLVGVLVLCLAAFAYSAPVLKINEQDEKCTVCEFMTTLIENYLAKGMDPAQIEKELHALCQRLPGGLSNICDSIISSGEVHLIIVELTNGTSPHLVCTQVKMCASQSLAELRTKIYQASRVTDERCTVCEFLTTLVEEYLAKGMKPSEIIAELKKMCGKLPGALSAICDNLVANGMVTKIITEITNGTSPHVVCSQLHLCPTLEKMANLPETPMVLASPTKKEKGEEECKVCELLTTLIEEFLAKGLNAQQIIAELKKICGKLPGALSAICDNLVENGMVSKIINELTNGTSPQVVCTQLHLCQSQLIAPVKEPILPMVTPPKEPTPKEIECAICKLGVSLAEYYLAQGNVTTKEAEKELMKVCDYFGKEKAFCVAMMMVEGPKIIKALEDKTPPHAVCETIKLCQASEYERMVWRKK